MGYSRQDAKDSVPEGWHGLVDELYDMYDQYGDGVEVLQVKEKFAGLVVYIQTGLGDEIFDATHEAWVKSREICEVCGKPGKVAERYSWMKTLCSDHERVWMGGDVEAE